MAHLYRGEMNRLTVWRQRLDVTSNWAILLTFGLTTFTLGSREVPHYTLLLGLVLIGISLVIEARRYRHLHRSKYRLHLMEVGYFAEILDPSAGNPTYPWRQLLAEDLRRTRFAVSWFAAIRLRLRRNYILLFYFISAVWLVKLFIHPASPDSAAQFLARFAIGGLVPSWLVAMTALGFVAVATVLAVTSQTGEELESWEPELAATSTTPLEPNGVIDETASTSSRNLTP